MSAQGDGFALRRVLVAIDASLPSLAALDAAAQLAGRLQLELTGLFVEDSDLVRVGRLPVARHVSLPSGAADEPWEPASVERQLRMLAGQAHAALVAATRRARVTASFEVVRGSVVSELLAAAKRSDLLILGSTSRPVTPRPRVGRTARAAAQRAPVSVLLLPRGAVLAGPVAVVYEGAAGSEAALAAGARLAEILRDELLVLGVAPSAETARAALQAAERWFARREPPPPHRSVACPGDLRGALAGQRKGMLVASASSPWVEGQRPHGLLEDLELPLLLVR